MSYYVIREGTKRGEGRYWGTKKEGSFSLLGWVSQRRAQVFDSLAAVRAVLGLSPLDVGRAVRIRPKHSGSYELSEQFIQDTFRRGRAAGLEEAERVCIDHATALSDPRRIASGIAEPDADACNFCADAIAEMKSSPLAGDPTGGNAKL